MAEKVGLMAISGKWASGANEFFSEEGAPLREIGEILDAEVMTGPERLDDRIHHIAATDLMSRVLAHSRPGTLLLTSLTNIQVVNTAEVAGLGGVVFMGGAPPPNAVIQKAQRLNLSTLLTPHSCYVACSLLFGWDRGT
jgi:hypothetical protein